jgi:multiple sugar transport system substrate-binding protein
MPHLIRGKIYLFPCVNRRIDGYSVAICVTGLPILAVSGLLGLSVLLGGCDRHSGAEQAVLHVWAHAGQEAERRVLQAQLERFNQQSGETQLKLTFIPERDYNAQVQAAALAGDLPDLLEFDGPYLYNYIWQQHLIPLEDLLPRALLNDLLPSIVAQGSYAGHLYSVGVYDSGLGLYARQSALLQIGARIPASAGDAWSIDEFNQILGKLAARDSDQAVLDIKLNYTGEWYTYGFSPLLQSAGADLIERRSYRVSVGTINNAAAVSAMQQLQSWIQQGYVDPNLDDAAFTGGRVAMSWVGHWEYERYRNAHKADLLVLPLPDFGQGSRTGQGSWNWGISRGSRHPQVAAQFIEFLMRTDEVLAMCDANGAVPGIKSAVQQSTLYGGQGPLALFAAQLTHGVSVPRPKTPAYPVITTEFQNAFQQIRNGGDVQQALNAAAQKIDQDILDNQGYPFIEQ